MDEQQDTVQFVRKTGNSATVGDSPSLYQVASGPHAGWWLMVGQAIPGVERPALEAQLEHPLRPGEDMFLMPPDMANG